MILTAAELADLRRLEEGEMVDRGVMRSPTGRSAQNSDGEEEPVYADEFTTRCRVGGPNRADTPTVRTVEIGGVERPVIEGGLRLPVGVPAVRRGWLFEITAVGGTSDPRLVGRKYLIQDDPVKTSATARRLDVVEV